MPTNDDFRAARDAMRKQPLYLHPRCHPTARTWTYLCEDHGANYCVVECAECRKPVARMRVGNTESLRDVSRG